jgi:hypothetical protein
LEVHEGEGEALLPAIDMRHTAGHHHPVLLPGRREGAGFHGALGGRCVPPWQITANTGENAASVAFGAVELALWDIRGKVCDMPLYKLLGGAVRKDIPFSEYFAFRPEHNGAGGEMTPEAIVEYCLGMRDEHGSTIFEGKLIFGDPLMEIRTVRLLREALGPQAQIRLARGGGNAPHHRGVAVAVPLAGRRRDPGRPVPPDQRYRARAGGPGARDRTRPGGDAALVRAFRRVRPAEPFPRPPQPGPLQPTAAPLRRQGRTIRSYYLAD